MSVKREGSAFSLKGVLAVVLLVVAGCAGPSAPTEAPRPTATEVAEATISPSTSTVPESPTPEEEVKLGGTLVYAFNQHPRRDSLDPQYMTGLPALVMADHIYDRLVANGPDGEYYPWLAESWDVSDDGLEYTFHLRRGVTFHDGTPFNAQAAKFNFDRGTAEQFSGNMFYNETTLIRETEVVDDYTFKIYLEDSDPAFLSHMARPMWGMISPAAIEEYGDEGIQQHPVGTGPFMFKEWVLRDHMTLVKNPDYNWASPIFQHQGPPYLDEVVFKFILEDTTRVAALQSGEVQLIEYVPEQSVSLLREDPNTTIWQTTKNGGPSTLEINVEKFPTNELAVRDAIRHGIDKELLVESIYFGVHKAAYGVPTPGIPGYDQDLEGYYSYDPEYAKKVLEEAGWVDTDGDGIREKGGAPLQIVVVTSTDGRAEEFAQAQLREVGIDMTIQILDPAGESAAWREAEAYNLARGLGGASGTLAFDCDILRILFHSSLVGIRNMSRWADSETDRFLEGQQREGNPVKRNEMCSQVQRIIAENALWAPLYLWQRVIGTTSNVEGLWFEGDHGYWLPLYDTYFTE